MHSEVKVTLWILTGCLAVCTLLSNSYILLGSLATCRLQRQKKGGAGGRWSPGDTIPAALSLACCAHQLSCYLWMTMDGLDLHCRLNPNIYTFTLLLTYSFKFTLLWDSALLTFYYCTKLVMGQNAAQSSRCWSRLQAAALTRYVVLLVPLLGLGTCMPMFAVFQPENSNATTVNQDCGVLVAASNLALVYEVAYLLLADVLPGVVMVRCCVSISTHLAAHLRSMKSNNVGNDVGARRRPRLGAQMRVIRMALSLVAVFAVFLVVDLYVQYRITADHENIISLAFFFTSVYTAMAATMLIYGRRSLSKALIRDINGLLDVFPCISCFKLPELKDVGDATLEATGVGGGAS